MTDTSEDWPYDEFGNLKYRVDVDRLLQGGGWDQPENPYDQSAEKAIAQAINICSCNLEDLARAIDELCKFLTNSPQLFPNNNSQIDSFRSIGGYAHGPWSSWVDVERSIIDSKKESQFIFLGKRCEQNHFCKLVWSPGNTFRIVWPERDSANLRSPVIKRATTKSTEELLEELSVPVDDSLPTEAIEELLTDATKDELKSTQRQRDLEELTEKRYDSRTFGDLDEAQSLESEDRWFEAGFSGEVSHLFRINKLVPEDVFEIMKFMPQTEVRNWVTQFKQNSLVALELLKLSREDSDNSRTTEIELEKKYSAALSESIRNAVSLQLGNWLRQRPPSKKR